MRRHISQTDQKRLTPRDWLPVAAQITADANERLGGAIEARAEQAATEQCARAYEAAGPLAETDHVAWRKAVQEAQREYGRTVSHAKEARRAALRDLAAHIGPNATAEAHGAPAFYRERGREIVIDSERALPGVNPAKVDWSDRRWRLEHLRAAGLVEHEVGHAAHTPRRMLREVQEAGEDVGRFSMRLEETRMEASHLRASGDREALAGVAHELILRSFDGVSGDAFSDAMDGALILGRDERHGGCLPSADVERFRDAYRTVHGEEWLRNLDELLGEWNGTEDADVPDGEGMRALMNRWRSTFGAPPSDESPGGEGEGESGGPESDADGGAAGIEGAGTPTGGAAGGGDTEGEDGDGQAGDVPDVREMLEQAAGEAATEAAKAARVEAEKEGQEDEEEVKRITHGYSPGSDRHHDVFAVPISTEAAQLRTRLTRELRRLQLPAITQTRRGSELPPGRLRGRGAVQRDAQSAAGMVPDAEPFRQVRRSVTKAPPPVVGIMLDVSGSMRSAAVPTASVAWALSEAGRAIQARTALVTFGDRGRIVEHNRGAITLTDCGGSWENFPEGFALLDQRLYLTSPARGARVVVVVTDGELVGPDTALIAQRTARWLERHGVAVVWAAIGVPKGEHRAIRLTAGTWVEVPRFRTITEAAEPIIQAIEQAVGRTRLEMGR